MADLNFNIENENFYLNLSGNILRQDNISDLYQALNNHNIKNIVIDATNLKEWDSSLLLILFKLKQISSLKNIKFKTKINRKSRETAIPNMKTSSIFVDEAEEENNSELEIVRTKRLSLKPMDSEEAVLQMNMLGHNFFIFEDAETNGTSIVYRRKDGKYGLIETD